MSEVGEVERRKKEAQQKVMEVGVDMSRLEAGRAGWERFALPV